MVIKMHLPLETADSAVLRFSLRDAELGALRQTRGTVPAGRAASPAQAVSWDWKSAYRVVCLRQTLKSSAEERWRAQAEGRGRSRGPLGERGRGGSVRLLSTDSGEDQGPPGPRRCHGQVTVVGLK